MNSLLRVSSNKSHLTPFHLVETIGQKHSVAKSDGPAASDCDSSHEPLWDTKEPPVAVKEKLLFLWWSILIILSQMWRDLFDLHNGFASLFLADLLSHFFVSHDCRPGLIKHG